MATYSELARSRIPRPDTAAGAEGGFAAPSVPAGSPFAAGAPELIGPSLR